MYIKSKIYVPPADQQMHTADADHDSYNALRCVIERNFENECELIFNFCLKTRPNFIPQAALLFTNNITARDVAKAYITILAKVLYSLNDSRFNKIYSSMAKEMLNQLLDTIHTEDIDLIDIIHKLVRDSQEI